ncbi:DNA polymerase LigD [Brevibacillus laterosporus]|uniref:DNA polymerase LigD n=1 Tax=Brevibacillus laterosporus TaxID=1465 RepID=A0A518VCC1_BRELA|nr:DNA polymerase LigD [Brevibacillus laterosporus]
MINKPIKPMLLHKSDLPPHGNLTHQLKFDGFRCIMSYDNGNTRLFTRHQNECTLPFPEIRPSFPIKNAIFDGEMVVMEGIKPCFESVMKRLMTKNDQQIERLSHTLPSHFVAFDILYLNDKDLTKLPLYERLDILNSVISPSNEISICPSSNDGVGLFNKTKELGLEGIVSKDLDSPYLLDTRSHFWLKTKAYLYETVTITGIRKNEFGWSLSKDGNYLGVMEFVPPDARKQFYQISDQIVTKDTDKWKYVQPLIKCEIKFQCYTKSRLLRSPSFVRFVS